MPATWRFQASDERITRLLRDASRMLHREREQAAEQTAVAFARLLQLRLHALERDVDDLVHTSPYRARQRLTTVHAGLAKLAQDLKALLTRLHRHAPRECHHTDALARRIRARTRAELTRAARRESAPTRRPTC